MSEQEEETTDEQKGETYKLTLEGGGVAVKREVDETTALQIIAAVMGGGGLPRVVAGSRSGGRATDLARSGPRTSDGGLSARGYMEEYEPKRNVDKILVLATYITDTREQDTVTPEDVKREFRNAAEPVPGNYGRDWKWAVQNDWLAPADGLPGEFYVTKRGRDALAAKFSADVKKSTSVNKTSRRRRTTK